MPKLYAAAEGISVCEKSDKFLSCVAMIYFGFGMFDFGFIFLFRI
jgi:hypothetical protein